MAIMAAATMATVVARPLSLTLVSRRRSRWGFSPLAYSSSSSSSSSSTRKLVLYSKPGCCLCDGLKEKLQAAFLLSGPDSLHDVDLQVTHFSHTHSLSLSVCSNLIDCVECVLLILSGERYYNQSWVGKVLPVWDTCIGQSTFWWHRGYFILFFFDFLLGNLFWNLGFSFVCWFLFQDSLIYTFLSH